MSTQLKAAKHLKSKGAHASKTAHDSTRNMVNGVPKVLVLGRYWVTELDLEGRRMEDYVKDMRVAIQAEHGPELASILLTGAITYGTATTAPTAEELAADPFLKKRHEGKLERLDKRAEYIDQNQGTVFNMMIEGLTEAGVMRLETYVHWTGGSQVKARQDPVGLWKLIKKSHQEESGGSTTLTKRALQEEFNKMRQQSGENIMQFKERIRKHVARMKDMHMKVPDDENQVTTFIAGLHGRFDEAKSDYQRKSRMGLDEVEFSDIDEAMRYFNSYDLETRLLSRGSRVVQAYATEVTEDKPSSGGGSKGGGKSSSGKGGGGKGGSGKSGNKSRGNGGKGGNVVKSANSGNSGGKLKGKQPCQWCLKAHGKKFFHDIDACRGFKAHFDQADKPQEEVEEQTNLVFEHEVSYVAREITAANTTGLTSDHLAYDTASGPNVVNNLKLVGKLMRLKTPRILSGVSGHPVKITRCGTLHLIHDKALVDSRLRCNVLSGARAENNPDLKVEHLAKLKRVTHLPSGQTLVFRLRKSGLYVCNITKAMSGEQDDEDCMSEDEFDADDYSVCDSDSGDDLDDAEGGFSEAEVKRHM